MTFDQAILASGLPRLDAEVLLGFAADCSRTALMTRGSDDVPETVLAAFESYAVRRRKHESVSHITGTKEFYGRPFRVSRDTLIPRPATESLVDVTLSHLKKPEKKITDADSGIVVLSFPLREIEPIVVVDVGTGSGCIAVTLAAEGIAERLLGVDISAGALAIAEENAKMHDVHMRIVWKESDGADAIRDLKEPFLVVSNPPYIPDGTPLEPSVANFEPATALFSGTDGLDLIRRLMASASENTHCAGIILECRRDQVEAIEEMAKKSEIRSQ
jgi:release factor glutamine methyltransferase